MIVYRKTEEERATRGLIAECTRVASEAASTLRHEAATELLMETGSLEAGIADALFAEADGVCEQSTATRKASVAAARVFIASWDNRPDEIKAWAGRLRVALAALGSMPLPARIRTRVPEGYAHYGLFPETYLKAARDFFDARRPGEAVCVGLRSIGTSLSALVAAALEEKGCSVRSFTLRPRSHPFRRKVRMTEALEHAVQGTGGHHLVVDEGPGLSGTSFASVVKKLSALGAPDDRIVLFPSWVPDGQSFVSKEARDMWPRHEKFICSFEDLWIRSGRLAQEADLGCGLTDLSAGSWRRLFFQSETDYPAAHPRHERRKYLAGDPDGRGAVLLKFAGHGRYGRKKLERALLLSDAGYCMPASGPCCGFLRHAFAPGKPLDESSVNQLLLDSMAGYLAFIRRSFPATGAMGFDEFCQMAARNITLGLGEKWAGKAAHLASFSEVYSGGAPVEVDGRMLPSEWLLTDRGYRKADALDHSADQFFPSSQDISWDLASAIVEFEMTPMEQNYFLARYSARSGERVCLERLRLYTVAYLAFRLGYSSFAAEELSSEPDGERFRTLKARYKARLKRELIWLEE